ncbi:MAG: tetratricopeptide repeat protein [candidate division Zixibacteria bacterium]|nr:tetratricopeptide repeat protein [candidate division Zixibacteria bacterium]
MRRKLLPIFILILALAGSAAGQDDSTSILIRRGGKSLMDKRYEDAWKQYTEALQRDPNNVETLRGLGMVASAIGNVKQARVYMNRAYALDSTDADVLNNLGVLYSQDGDHVRAIEFFARATVQDSTHLQYHTNLAGEYMAIGQVENALPVLRWAAQLDSAISFVPFQIANCLSAQKKYDSAETYYARAIAKGGETAELFYRMGVVKVRLDKSDEAESFFKKAINTNPSHKEARQSLGLIYASRREFVASAMQFQKAVEIDSAFYPAWIALGVSYALVDDMVRADSVMARLLQADSSMAYQMARWIQLEQSRKNPADSSK